MARIVFWGTPQIAAQTLVALVEAGHEVPLVICQPDRRQGRGKTLQSQAVKQQAQALGLAVQTPTNPKAPDCIALLRSVEADFFVVIAYGRILSENLLDIPKHCCLNVHYSLLPRWRGAAPMEYSLLHGDATSGVSVIAMDKGMDTGDLLCVREFSIGEQMLIGDLRQALCTLGQEALLHTLHSFASITPQPQDHTQATFAPSYSSTIRCIDWEESTKTIIGKFRAFSPKPGVYSFFRGKRVALLELSPAADQALSALIAPTNGTLSPPGTCHMIGKSLYVSTGDGAVQIRSLRFENKAAQQAGDFINGYRPTAGERFTTATQ